MGCLLKIVIVLLIVASAIAWPGNWMFGVGFFVLALLVAWGLNKYEDDRR